MARCHQYALGIEVVTIRTVQPKPLDCTASPSLIPSARCACGAIGCNVANSQDRLCRRERRDPRRRSLSCSIPDRCLPGTAGGIPGVAAEDLDAPRKIMTGSRRLRDRRQEQGNELSARFAEQAATAAVR